MPGVETLAQSANRSRTCVACGHAHPYATPIYRCEECGVWGQDFYELPPYRPTLLARILNWLRGLHV